MSPGKRNASRDRTWFVAKIVIGAIVITVIIAVAVGIYRKKEDIVDNLPGTCDLQIVLREINPGHIYGYQGDSSFLMRALDVSIIESKFSYESDKQYRYKGKLSSIFPTIDTIEFMQVAQNEVAVLIRMKNVKVFQIGEMAEIVSKCAEDELLMRMVRSGMSEKIMLVQQVHYSDRVEIEFIDESLVESGITLTDINARIDGEIGAIEHNRIVISGSVVTCVVMMDFTSIASMIGDKVSVKLDNLTSELSASDYGYDYLGFSLANIVPEFLIAVTEGGRVHGEGAGTPDEPRQPLDINPGDCLVDMNFENEFSGVGAWTAMVSAEMPLWITKVGRGSDITYVKAISIPPEKFSEWLAHAKSDFTDDMPLATKEEKESILRNLVSTSD